MVSIVIGDWKNERKEKKIRWARTQPGDEGNESDKSRLLKKNGHLHRTHGHHFLIVKLDNVLLLFRVVSISFHLFLLPLSLSKKSPSRLGFTFLFL
jgi:hypothetical protein